MSLINNCIRTALDLKDKNITFAEDFCIEKDIKGLRSKIYPAVLTYVPDYCPCCGVINESFSIVKHGYIDSRITWISNTHFPTYIQLRKQRFLCRECHSTFVATSPEIEQHCFISNRVKQSIMFELADAISMKDLSKRHFVSLPTIGRTLKQAAYQLKPNFNRLPKHLSWDEFKSVKRVAGKMRFIMIDAETHALIDILPNRLLNDLTQYFYRYSLQARLSVETITVDMNSSYATLVSRIFPNAKIIIDRFHIIQMMTNALNMTRIRIMNKFNTYRPEDQKKYRKLKRYWRMLLKNSEDLDFKNFHYHRLFKKHVSQTEIVDYLVSLDPELKETYITYQNLLYSSVHNDYEAFYEELCSASKNVSPQMIKTIKTLKKNSEGIKNTFHYKYTNGPIEGMINKIKVISRVSYGYRSFWNLKCRILISFHLKTKQ